MIKRALIICLLFLSTNVFADIIVSEFRLLPSDQTANIQGTEVFDQNNNRCALIKVETVEKGFEFEVGVFHVQKVDPNHIGETWVYVPPRVQHLTIHHPHLGTLREYQFPCPIESGRTYLLKLVSGTTQVVVTEALTEEFVEFTISPAGALIQIDDSISLPTDRKDGYAQTSLSLGTHHYLVEDLFYHSEAGAFEVTYGKKDMVHIRLRPNFGFLKILGNDAKGGAVYLDDNRSLGTIGNEPLLSGRIKSGTHRIKIVKNLYKTYEKTIEIKDNDTLRLFPQLESNFGSVTLVTEKNAEIWINDVKKGTGSVAVELAVGRYLCVTKLENHRDATTTIQITKDMQGEVPLKAPIPITTSLSIESTPARAAIYLDDEYKGETPLQLRTVLIGEHTIKIKKQGFVDYSQQIFLEEHQHKAIQAKLNTSSNVTLTASKQVEIAIRKQDEETYQHLTSGTRWIGELEVGSYVVRTHIDGCNDAFTLLEISTSSYVKELNIPTPKKGYLSITSTPSGADVYVDNKKLGITPFSYYLSPGNHQVYLSKSGYQSSAIETIYIGDRKTLEKKYNLKRIHIRASDYHPDHYLETFYGFGVANQRLEQSHYVGLNYSWIPRYVGLNISPMYGISTNDLSLTMGPAFRLIPLDKEVSLQLLLGAGVVCSLDNFTMLNDFKQRLNWIVDAGFRISFTPEDSFAWWSINLGCKYYDQRYVPNVGISLMPLRLLVLAAEADEYPIQHFMEFIVGGVVQQKGGIMFGATYSYLPAHLGFFLSGMGGTRGCASITTGLAFRLLPDYISDVFDWHIYAGPGWGMYNGNHNAIGDIGMRFAFNTGKSRFCIWSFSGGVQVTEGYVAPYGGISLGITLVVGTAGLGTLLL